MPGSSRRAALELRRLACGALLSAILHALAGSAQPEGFEPVSVSCDTASIRLSVIGTYRGGMYSTKTPASPPGFDPETARHKDHDRPGTGLDASDRDSPIDAPMLVVLHELSDSATLYRIDPATR